MKVLFLDDDPERHRRFAMAHIGCDVTYMWVVAEAIAALDREHHHQASLDHDLGGVASQLTLPEAGESSGYDVALHIASMPADRRPDLVVVHSFNPEGARRMVRALHGHVPHVYRSSFNY